ARRRSIGSGRGRWRPSASPPSRRLPIAWWRPSSRRSAERTRRVTFDPAAHPGLIDLSRRLPDLAGDGAYTAGRAYCAKGLVKQGSVTGTTAYATVSGSSDY